MSGSNEQKIIKWIGSFLGAPFVEDFYEIYRKNDRINEIVKFLNEHPEYKDYIVNDEKDETKQISDEVKKIFADNAYSDLPLSYEQLLEEKGIEDIINAVKEVNEKYKKTIYTLDIYGPVDRQQTDWFEQLQKSFPDYVKYKGMVQFDKSVEVLKEYFFLAFPTRFYTEGIPGTILDAYAAGVPVVASKWESFNDVVDDESTGIGYEFADYQDLKHKLEHIYEKPEEIIALKKTCLKKAEEYLPQAAIEALIDEL